MSDHSFLRLSAALASFALLTMPTLSVAQEGPMGIGVAQAEEGTWWCRDTGAAAALDCAEAQCIESGNSDDNCYQTQWCFPARWTGMMTVWQADFHSTYVLCGATSREAVEAGLSAICSADPYAANCDLFLVIDPDGMETSVFDVSWPGGAAMGAGK